MQSQLKEEDKDKQSQALSVMSQMIKIHAEDFLNLCDIVRCKQIQNRKLQNK